MKKRLLSLIPVVALMVCFSTAASAQQKLPVIVPKGSDIKPFEVKPSDAPKKPGDLNLQDIFEPKQHVAFCKELKAEETHLESLLSAHSKHKSSCTDIKSPIKTAKGSCSVRAAALDRCLTMTLGEIKSESNEHKCSLAGTITKKP
ncbi:MAG: hypothetical protein JWO20_1495 [Candidatus Angelobacter sp.]|jgi:hypothetical protein|nr:hypothetical protein [Candidatus Angelobacter sp.]